MSEFTDDDALAAEYVIGTLPSDERIVAEARLQRDAGFDTLVRDWTERLSPLLDTVPAVEPDARLRDALLSQIGGVGVARGPAPVSPATDNVVMLRRQVTRWRLATALCGGLAAMLAIWLATSRFVLPPEPAAYMAVLQQGGGAPAFLVSLDLANRRMTVVPTDTPAEPDKSFELWMIGSDEAGPRSLGLVDSPKPIRASLPDVSPALISHATYAVTLEPKGGSPSGKPTSAPIFTGHLVPTDAAATR